ncbi:TPA: DUF3948 family protein, partial [Bacillus thuringiensis]|nr:DUF3948 family protein [Bacillus cereus]HDR7850732.1 DUF3948 family protein [Bacillus toyonensis]HDR4799538.1 DUF3948 family protein [Bacillus cereus]HDR4811597.1 DUF3948 family protein [Bacillus cereus]HDR4834051.1 DUF3948 family protein [Bacillus cereus]
AVVLTALIVFLSSVLV